MRQLLEAGVSLRPPDARWNPQDGGFIYGDRNGIHIIDLTQTVPMLDAALAGRAQTPSQGRPHPVRRHQASGAEARRRSRREMRAVLHEPPLLGGTLTNWKTSHSRSSASSRSTS